MNRLHKTLLFEVLNNVAHITLNRPEAANALNEEIVEDLMNAILQCDEDPTIRAVLISGAGDRFCAGGDLKSFSNAGPRLPSMLKKMTLYLHAAISRLTRINSPVIAAVQGAAAGAGMGIVCAADIVIAAETARFMMAYTQVGLTPDGSSTYFLPRIVGHKRALELTLTNRILTAKEALEWGIVTRVVPDADLLIQAGGLAAELAAGPTIAFGSSKRLLHQSWTETLETQMEHESQAIARMARSKDAGEGIAAFLEKRPPKFAG